MENRRKERGSVADGKMPDCERNNCPNCGGSGYAGKSAAKGPTIVGAHNVDDPDAGLLPCQVCGGSGVWGTADSEEGYCVIGAMAVIALVWVIRSLVLTFFGKLPHPFVGLWNILAWSFLGVVMFVAGILCYVVYVKRFP